MIEHQHSIEEIFEALDGPHGDNKSLFTNTKALVDAANFPMRTEFADAFIENFSQLCANLDLEPPHRQLAISLKIASAGLYIMECLTRLPPDPSLYGYHGDNVVLGQIRDLLVQLQEKARKPDETVARLMGTICGAFVPLVRALPPLARWTDEVVPSAPQIALIDVLSDLPSLVEQTIQPFIQPEVCNANLFRLLREQLQKNERLIAETTRSKHPIPPGAFKGSPRELVAAYLHHTPLEDIFMDTQVPFSIPPQTKFEHTFILGGAGAGKTTLLQNLILEDTSSPMVVIDPKGEMVKRLSKLRALHDGRLVLIDPGDTPALNMFAPSKRWEQLDHTSRLNVQGQATANFSYIFSSIESPLTQKQLVCFTFCVRLLFTIPHANISTLVELLEDSTKFPKDPEASARASPFFPHFERLVRDDGTTRHFFLHNFYSPTYSETRQQIMARLYGILMHPQLMAMFAASDRKVDIFDCLQNNKIVLVNGALGSPGI